MAERIRIAVAGAGAFGREHLQTLASMDGVELAGVADIDAQVAAAAGERFAIRSSTDAAAMIEVVRPHGLVVATPGHTHTPLATLALQLGIAVLVEKPVAMTAAEARSLAAVESASSAFVLPGHILRFSEAHRLLTEIAASNAVGPILSVTSRRHRDDSHARRYRDIDPVLMTMIHDIDLAVWITGSAPAAVTALRRPRGEQRSLTVATIEDAKGAAWRLDTAWTFPGEAPPDRIEVIGERGGVELEVGSQLRQFGAVSNRVDLTERPEDPLRVELAYFVDCIRSGRRPEVVTLAEAITGLTAAEAVMASLQDGAPVRL